jgi:hypothetical protein
MRTIQPTCALLVCAPMLACAGTLGTWTNVTPAGIDLNPASFGNDNFGVQDVLADPARPSDLYAFTCHQGVWKSVDYGLTWAKVNTGTNGATLDTGKLWTAAIEPNPNRNPNSPPTLWTATGNNAAGVWKSVDGGVSWTSYAVNNATATAASGNAYFGNDVYALDVDPNDALHLIAGFHGFPGISESIDGGAHWTTIVVPNGIGASLYPFFVHTGGAATTRATWLTQAQWDSNTAGIWRTDNSGTTWTHVAPAYEHKHGSTQFHQPGDNVVTRQHGAGERGVRHAGAPVFAGFVRKRRQLQCQLILFHSAAGHTVDADDGGACDGQWRQARGGHAQRRDLCDRKRQLARRDLALRGRCRRDLRRRIPVTSVRR